MTVNSGATVQFPTSNEPTVTGTLMNNGTLQQTKSVTAGAGDVNFFNTGGYGGVTINAPHPLKPLGNTTVTIKGNQAKCATTIDTSVRCCVNIAPTNTTGRNVVITIYFSSAGAWRTDL